MNNNNSSSDRSQKDRDPYRPNTKIERDMGRVCPSKLSKRELEDLYFTLIENNQELKRTINKQNDKIKILSTKVQRLSSGRISSTGVKEKDCCASKEHIAELKDTISELKRANDGLAERIRLLNMRLCSAKQFLGKNPSRHKCNLYSSSTPSTSNARLKDKVDGSNSPMTPSHSEDNISNGTLKDDCVTPRDSNAISYTCNENKCKITVEELRQTIDKLKVELANSRAEYSCRLGRLEGEVRSVREESVEARADGRSHQLRADRLLHRLAALDATANDLEARLSIERRKVLELETRLKLADISIPLSKSLEKLNNLSEPSAETHTSMPDKPTVDKSITDRPRANKLTADKPTGDKPTAPANSPTPQNPIQAKDSKAHKNYEKPSEAVPIKRTKREGRANGPSFQYTPPQFTGSVFRYSPPQIKDKKSAHQRPRSEPKSTHSVKTQTSKRESKAPAQEPKVDTQAVPFQETITSTPFQEPPPPPAIPFQTFPAIEQNSEAKTALAEEEIQKSSSPLVFQERARNVSFDEKPQLETLEGRAVLHESAVDTQSDDLNQYKPAFIAVTCLKEAESASQAVSSNQFQEDQPFNEPGSFQEEQRGSVRDPAALLLLQKKLKSQADPDASLQIASLPITYQESESFSPNQDGQQKSVAVTASIPIQEQKCDAEIDEAKSYQVAATSIPFQEVSGSVLSEEAKREQKEYFSAPALPAEDKEKSDTQQTIGQATLSQIDDRSIPFKEAKQQFEPSVSIRDQINESQNYQPAPILSADFSVPFQEEKLKDESQNYIPASILSAGSSVPFQEEKHKEESQNYQPHSILLAAPSVRVQEEKHKAEATRVPTEKNDIRVNQAPYIVDPNIPSQKIIDKESVPFQEAKQASQPLPGPSRPVSTKRHSACSQICQDTGGAYDASKSAYIDAEASDSSKSAYHDSDPYEVINDPSPESQFIKDKLKTSIEQGFPFPHIRRESLASKRESYLSGASQNRHLADTNTSQATERVLEDDDNILKTSSVPDKSPDIQFLGTVSREPPLFYDPSKVIETNKFGTKEKSETETTSATSRIIRLIDINPLVDEYPQELPSSSYSPTRVIEAQPRDLEAKLQFQPIASPQKQREGPISSPKKGDDDLKWSAADDSGYVEQEPQKDDEMLRINRDLLKKIADLRAQLDLLIIASAGANNKPSKPVQEMRSNRQSLSDEESLRGFRNKKFEEIVVEVDSDECLHKQIPHNDAEPEYPVSATKEMTTSLMNVTDKWEEKSECSDEEEIKRPLPLPRAEIIQHKPAPGEETKSLRFDNIETQLHPFDEIEETKSIPHLKADQKRDSKIGNQDEHNRYQIPGPIPSIYPSPRERKPKDKKQPEDGQKTVKIVANDDDQIYIPHGAKQHSVHIEEDDKITTFLHNLKERRRSKGVSITDEEFDRNRFKEESGHKSLEDEKAADNNFLDLPVIIDSGESAVTSADVATQINVDKEIALCWSGARVCACARGGGAVPPLRTCSGLRLMPPHHAARYINYCVCAQHKSSTEKRCPSSLSTKSEYQPPISHTLHHAQTQVEDPSCPLPDTHTYDVTRSKCSRSTSPDNTEKEISSLPDLPHEREVKHDGGSLSPGEKGTMTVTETETNTDFASLSEGEIPATKKLQKSYNERGVTTANVGTESSQRERMEAALQAISAELTRCHQLLETQNNKRTEVEETRSVRAAEGAPHLAPASHHVCVFTLHVGTLVLSDEAVLNFRDKSLVLMWRFYDQSVTLTRMRAGRVVLFDFSTEYDIVFSTDFLQYMKNGKMPLVICELNKQDVPIASCSLPLRDALLHLNRRADMSLALMSGEALGPGAEQELGVLDLWCVLRADSTVARVVHNAIARTSQVMTSSNGRPSTTRSYSRLLEDEFSNDRLSQDLDLNMKTVTTPTNKKFQRPALVTYPTQEPANHNNVFGNDDHRSGSASKGDRRRSSSARKTDESIVLSNLGHKENQGLHGWTDKINRNNSGFIANAVPASIKTTEEMKAVLGRKAQNDEFKRFGRSDDAVSQGQSSIGSVRSHSRKLHLARLEELKRYPQEPIDSLQDLLNKETEPTRDRKHSYIPKCELVPTEFDKTDETSDISRKYKDISKFLGVNKMIESKKQVKYSDSEERPEKEASDTEGQEDQSIEITVLWLALNEECDAMVNPAIKRLYVAYNFLGRSGADLETPVSLPKPKHYVDKCYFNFKKTFNLHECDLVALGHMARVRSGPRVSTDPRDCLVFTVVSEPPEDPLGLTSCEDVGYAYLYLGDILAYSGGSSIYTEVVAVHAARGAAVCGVLAVRLDGLQVLRRALTVSSSTRDLSRIVSH